MANDNNCCERYGTCARITVMIFTAAGLAFSILAVQSCEFLEFSTTNLGGRSGKAGLFQYTDENGECVSYPDDVNIGSTDNTSRSCGALAAIFGLIALCLIMFEFCICKLCCARLLESCVYAVAYICQGLTFFIYNNSTLCTGPGNNCTWGQGSIWSVIAFCLYFLSSCIMCCAPKSEPLLCKHRQAKKDAKAEQEIRDDQQEKDQAAYEAEQAEQGAADSTPVGDSSTPPPGASGSGDAAAHASAY